MDPPHRPPSRFDRNDDGLWQPEEVEDAGLYPAKVAFVEPASVVHVDLQDTDEYKELIADDVDLVVTRVTDYPSPGRELIGEHVTVSTDESGNLEEPEVRKQNTRRYQNRTKPGPEARSKSGKSPRAGGRGKSIPAEIRRFARNARR